MPSLSLTDRFHFWSVGYFRSVDFCATNHQNITLLNPVLTIFFPLVHRRTLPLNADGREVLCNFCDGVCVLFVISDIFVSGRLIVSCKVVQSHSAVSVPTTLLFYTNLPNTLLLWMGMKFLFVVSRQYSQQLANSGPFTFCLFFVTINSLLIIH